MPIFSKKHIFIPENYGAAFPVSGFQVANEKKSYPNLEPFPYDTSLVPFSGVSGISQEATVASGEFFTSSPLISWNILNPSTEAPISVAELGVNRAFEGVNLYLLDETGFLIKELTTGYRLNSLTLPVSDIKNYFDEAVGDTAFTDANNQPGNPVGKVGMDPRAFRLRTESIDYYGRMATGEYLLTAPSPDITGMTVSYAGKSVQLSPAYTKTSGIRAATVYLSTDYNSFNLDLTGSGIQSYNYSQRFHFGETFNPSFSGNA